MIEMVLTHKGQVISRKELYTRLLEIQPKETLYPEKRALGSIGGAVTQEFIARRDADKYIRSK